MIDFKLAVPFFLAFLLMSQKCASQPGKELNLGFEEWVDSSLLDDSATFNNSTGHLIPNPFLGRPVNWKNVGVHRTSDAHSGNFAMVVHQWYLNYSGKGSLGSCEGPSSLPCKVSAGSNIEKVSGFYKYFNENNRLAKAVFVGLSIDSLIQIMDTVSFIEYYFQPVDIYTFFEIPIYYYADSSILTHFMLYFESPEVIIGTSPICLDNSNNKYCNFLYLDDIAIDFASTTSAKNKGEDTGIIFFPNPIVDVLNIINNEHHPTTVRVINSLGVSLQSFLLLSKESQRISFLNYPAGLYFLAAENEIFKIIKVSD